ncbi:MAG: hypothetical protein MZU91_00735 [Desulfosudis oleivorans]|nr:hypothetical protein [Desulfosudis oleivorans]
MDGSGVGGGPGGRNLPPHDHPLGGAAAAVPERSLGRRGADGRARQDDLHGRLQRRPLPRVRLRQQLPPALQGQTGAAEPDQKDDAQLMLLGFDWIKLFLWGLRSRKLKPR